MIKNGERKLAYITVIDEIKPIPNADKIELARVGGWQVVVSKADNYKVGDKVIYIEIDSKVPSDKECFAFLTNHLGLVQTPLYIACPLDIQYIYLYH